MVQDGKRSKEGTGMKILITDDNSQNLYLLEVLLNSAGIITRFPVNSVFRQGFSSSPVNISPYFDISARSILHQE
ncbi:hypothetical protein [uncultured Methanoregula sp.]|uniref:hypothetical protein n=1 Tax=uncultured Methanoregula sp. TaxID=1005933 RepID=UPI002AAB09C1|nr:hypothetical protein [uncultured Methanoregula sp.]